MQTTMPKSNGIGGQHDVLTVIVIGLGQMGRSHALAYHHNSGFRIVGLIYHSDSTDLYDELKGYPRIASIEEALELKPDVVSINTHTDTHVQYAILAMENGCHVFVEKPLAATLAEAERVVEVAHRTGRKLVIGYILRHHPSWHEFVKQARLLGPPFVMRMNLNQRSTGNAWAIHKRLMKSASPPIDCGVHYVDVMLQISDSKPVQVRGMGIRLTDEISPDQVNYGHLQIIFADGSVAWYEAGWGPMMSETACFVKDVISPNGSVSIALDEGSSSADVNSHTKTSKIRLRRVGDQNDTMISMKGEPDHNALCALEQQFLLDAIREDRDLTEHMNNAVQSLAIVLAADKSMRERRAVDL